MRAIGANCREQFRADDFAFVAATLAGRPDRTASLAELLTDANARDAALDSDAVFAALVDQPEPLPVSPHLYFYVVTRHGLMKFDRVVADYIANVLAAFLDSTRARRLPGAPDLETDYLTEMLEVLTRLSGTAAFVTRAHVGNYSLFMSGIFADHLRYREWRRGAPGIAFYEEVGSTNYRLASGHDQARRAGLDEVLRTIGEGFSEVRLSLNRVADRFLHLEGDHQLQP
jgi:hypothetical protein